MTARREGDDKADLALGIADDTARRIKILTVIVAVVIVVTMLVSSGIGVWQAFVASEYARQGAEHAAEASRLAEEGRIKALEAAKVAEEARRYALQASEQAAKNGDAAKLLRECVEPTPPGAQPTPCVQQLRKNQEEAAQRVVDEIVRRSQDEVKRPPTTPPTTAPTPQPTATTSTTAPPRSTRCGPLRLFRC